MADSNFAQQTGAVLQSLPIDELISAPLLAAIAAQVKASAAYVAFVRNVGLVDGKAVMVAIDYSEDILDGSGTVTGTRRRSMNIPLLAMVSHPNVNIDTIDINFEVTVDTSEATQSDSSMEGAFEASAGWAVFSVKVSGKASHSSSQTRKTDTRAKYSIGIKAKRDGPPEGMMRVLDALTDEACRSRLISPTTQA